MWDLTIRISLGELVYSDGVDSESRLELSLSLDGESASLRSDLMLKSGALLRVCIVVLEMWRE